MNEMDTNQKIAEEICNTHRLNGRVFRKGDWIALLDGKVVAVAAELDDALRELRRLDSNPHRGMILEVGPLHDVIR